MLQPEYMHGTLYMVATPIGNLEDITLRAMNALKSVDGVVCEDTRVTRGLLTHIGASAPAVSIHEHSSDEGLQRIVERLVRGESLAYVCDAGTPGMNDPGGKLVERAFLAGVRVVPLPGASSLTAAISACGFPMDDFVYRGFVPHKKGRETFFREMAETPEAVVFLESTHRIDKTLEQMLAMVGTSRLLFVGREMTKLHETLYRGTIDEVTSALHSTSTKGEFTLILAPTAFTGIAV